MSKYKLQYLIFLIKKLRFRKIYNLVWSYLLWLNYPVRTKIISGIFPKLIKEPYPPFIEIETSTKCPFRCVVCEHTYWKEPAQNMTFDQFKHIVDQFPKLKWAGLTGIGESWSNTEFGQMVEYITKTSNPVIELVDNFSLMTEEKSRRMISYEVDIFFISMMGSTKETYEKIMGGMKLENVTKNIKGFFRIRKEMKSLTPLVNFHYVICKTNMHEALSFLDYVKDFNADVYEVLYTPILHTFHEIQGEEITQADIDGLKPKLLARGRELGLHVAFNECLMESKLPIRKCSNWIMPFIFVNGEVSPCCTSNESNQRERQYSLSLGNVFKQSFSEIWYGEKYSKFRDKIRRNETPEQCQDCPVYIKSDRK